MLWAAAYVLVTTLAFSPTLSFRDSPVAPGMVAPRDVVAPRDLIVPDPDATARRRAEAAAEVLPVYEFDAHGAGALRGGAARVLRPGPARRGPDPAAGARDAGARATRSRCRSGTRRSRPSPARASRRSSRTGSSRSGSTSTGAASWTIATCRPEARGRGLDGTRPRPGRETAAPRERRGRVRQRDQVRRWPRGWPTLPLSARERAEVAAFLAATLRPNLDLRRGADRRAPARGRRALGRERVHAHSARQGDRPPGRRDHGARGPVDRGRARLGVRPVVLGQGHGRPDPADPRGRRLLARRAAAAPAPARTLDRGRLRLGARDRDPLRRRRRAGHSPWRRRCRPRLEGASGAVNYAIPFAAGPIVVSLVAGHGAGAARRARPRDRRRRAHGVCRFPFALFSVVGSLAGIYGLGQVRARSVLLAMGGIVADRQPRGDRGDPLPRPPGRGAGTSCTTRSRGSPGGLTVSMVVGPCSCRSSSTSSRSSPTSGCSSSRTRTCRCCARWRSRRRARTSTR